MAFFSFVARCVVLSKTTREREVETKFGEEEGGGVTLAYIYTWYIFAMFVLPIPCIHTYVHALADCGGDCFFFAVVVDVYMKLLVFS